MNRFITRRRVSWVVGILSFMALESLLNFVADKFWLDFLIDTERPFGLFMSVLCILAGARAGMAFHKKSWNGGVKKETNIGICIIIVCGLVVALLSEIVGVWLGGLSSVISCFILVIVAWIYGFKYYYKIIDEGKFIRLLNLAQATPPDHDAQYRIGAAYENTFLGTLRGIKKDDEKAMRWYKLAVDGGHLEAKKALESLLYDREKIYRNTSYLKDETRNGYPREFFLVSRQLKIKNNYICQDCGVCLILKKEWNHGGLRRYLHAHHINGDKKDNREANLRILCVDCHFNGYHPRREGDAENENIKICRKIKKIQKISFSPYNYFYFEKGKTFYSQKKYNEAFPLIKITATQGYVNAQFILACMYHYGRGVKEDKTESAEWCRKAAKQGHMLAQYTLGMKYYYGKNVRKNSLNATRWFKKAAEQGHIKSQLLINYIMSQRKSKKQKKEPLTPTPIESSAKRSPAEALQFRNLADLVVRAERKLDPNRPPQTTEDDLPLLEP